MRWLQGHNLVPPLLSRVLTSFNSHNLDRHAILFLVSGGKRCVMTHVTAAKETIPNYTTPTKNNGKIDYRQRHELRKKYPTTVVNICIHVQFVLSSLINIVTWIVGIESCDRCRDKEENHVCQQDPRCGRTGKEISLALHLQFSYFSWNERDSGENKLHQVSFQLSFQPNRYWWEKNERNQFFNFCCSMLGFYWAPLLIFNNTPLLGFYWPLLLIFNNTLLRQ